MQRGCNKVDVTRDDYLGYFCGLISADGCLASSKPHSGVINIHLQERDIDTIVWLENTFKSNPRKEIKAKPRKDNPNHAPLVGFSLSSDYMYDYLMAMGVTPRKSLTLDVNLDDKSDKFKWYFLRGVIDGDGTAYLHPRIPSQSRIQIASASLKFLHTIQYWFGGKVYKTPDVWILTFTGYSAQRLAEHLPKDHFCIKRKTENIIKISQFDFTSKQSPKVGKLLDGISAPLTLKERWRQSNVKLSYEGLLGRLRRGISVEEALSFPSKYRKDEI